jgi:hypothetical protein
LTKAEGIANLLNTPTIFSPWFGIRRFGKLCVMASSQGQEKKIRLNFARLSAANRWPMDLRWGHRRDKKNGKTPFD